MAHVGASEVLSVGGVGCELLIWFFILVSNINYDISLKAMRGYRR